LEKKTEKASDPRIVGAGYASLQDEGSFNGQFKIINL
jgi:hypothetical protein